VIRQSRKVPQVQSPAADTAEVQHCNIDTGE